MKILILIQNIKNMTNLIDGLSKAKNLSESIGLNLEYTFQDTQKKFTTFKFQNSSQPDGVAINGTDILNEVHGKFRIACLIFDWTKYEPRPTNPVTQTMMKDNCIPMQIPEQWYGDFPEVLAQYLLHELCHAGFYLSGQKDTTHDFYTSEFSQQPDGVNKYYLFLLKDLKIYLENMKPTTVPTYKYFNPKSDPLMVGVNHTLMTILDKIRDLAGVPVKITSGLRTKEQNKAVGGKDNSAHLKGLAVDILCSDNQKRTILTKAILNCGTPVFLEIAKSHLHIDIDSSIHKLGDTIVSDDD